MQHLFSTPSDEDFQKKRSVSRQFDSNVQRSDSVRNLVALTAQIPRYSYPEVDESEDVDGGGYWSSPEDHVTYLEGRGMDEDSPNTAEPNSSPNEIQRTATATVTAWSDSEIM